MGNSYLTFNYKAAEFCKELGHIVHQSEKDFEVCKREERINWGKLGHKDEPSVTGLICDLQLTPATPRDMSLSVSHISYCIYRMCPIC